MVTDTGHGSDEKILLLDTCLWITKNSLPLGQVTPVINASKLRLVIANLRTKGNTGRRLWRHYFRGNNSDSEAATGYLHTCGLTPPSELTFLNAYLYCWRVCLRDPN